MVIFILMAIRHVKNKIRLVEKEHAYIVSGSSPIVGFTKDSVCGKPGAGTRMALAFLGRRFDVAYMEQVHGSKVMAVKRPGRYRCDGIVTDKKGIALVVKTADCMPIILYNNRSGAIAAVHMGWRSARDGILENLPFADLSDFVAVAGVGMRKCCYRVGSEFAGYERVAQHLARRSECYYFDPVGFILETLTAKGLKAENFIDTDICTQCSGYDIFSYRKTKTEDRTLTFVLRY